MGILDKLFRTGTDARPPWAKPLVAPATYRAFTASLDAVLDEEGVELETDALASGVIVFGDAGFTWSLPPLLKRFAAAPSEARRDLVRDDLRRALAPPWILGIAPWGGVSIEIGPGRLALVVLPIDDATDLAAIPETMLGAIEAVVVLNHGDEGYLAASRIAAAAGLPAVFASVVDAPVDRPAGTAGAVTRLPFESIALSGLALERRGSAVLARRADGRTALVGSQLRLPEIVDARPDMVVGTLDIRRGDADAAIDLASNCLEGKPKAIRLVGNGAASDALADAQFLAQLGIACA